MKTKWVKFMGVLFVVCVCFLLAGNQAEAKTKTYTITTKTTPVTKKTKKLKTYNKNTRQYYTIQSYLTKLGKTGGTLKLKKGTYKIPCTLYVPSNVTIQCNTGVTLLKTSKTGTKKLKSTKYMFQFVSEAKSAKKAKVAKYKASSNVSIVGSGTVNIKMGKISGATAIYAGHAKNVTISNITFKNKNNSSYIWVEGSKNVTITKCKFYGGTDKTTIQSQLAIRLENINTTINEFTGTWSKLDNTINNGINISSNTFYAMNSCIGSAKHVAVGTTVYYQKGITITGNTFRNTAKYVVYGIDWNAPSITSNVMKKTAGAAVTTNFVRGLGFYNPVIKGNTIKSCDYAMYFDPAKNTGTGSTMAANNSAVSEAAAAEMQNNTISGLTHYYVPLNGTRLFYFLNKTDKNFTINTSTEPYHEKYTDKSDYSTRKVYYVFLSYMEQLEYTGGGTVTVEAGTYPVTNNICIPSNVVVNLKDGVVLQKSGNKSATVAYAKSIFTIVPPSKDGTKATVSGYNGSSNVMILGSGNACIDCADVTNCMGLVMGHAKDVTVRGITFMNEYGSHFIELNSSNNVVVENCTFIGFRPYEQKSYKECINVDGTDENTNGFNYDWSSHDKTTCKDVYIRNNSFKDVGTAVGSHTFSANGNQQLYHDNVQITNNTVDGTYNAAIRAMNWSNCIIQDNTFKNLQILDDGKTAKYVGIYLRGVVNPTVTKNIFENMADDWYPIRVIMSCSANVDDAQSAGYPNTVSEISDENWKAMQDNTLINSSDERKFIVVWMDDTKIMIDGKEEKDREKDEETDEERVWKIPIGDQTPDTPDDPDTPNDPDMPDEPDTPDVTDDPDMTDTDSTDTPDTSDDVSTTTPDESEETPDAPIQTPDSASGAAIE